MTLVNIGFGSMVAAGRVLSILAPDSAPIKRIIQEAKDRGIRSWKGHGFGYYDGEAEGSVLFRLGNHPASQARRGGRKGLLFRYPAGL